MESLKNQALELLRREKSKTFLVSSEEYDYFHPKKGAPLPLPKKAADPMGDIRALVTKTLPDAALTTAIPDDAVAKKQAHLWQQTHLSAQVFVIGFADSSEFLQNVVKAIDTHLAPAAWINGPQFEKEKNWELALAAPSLKLIIAPPFSTWKTTTLARFYKENPTTKALLLHTTPLLLMHPVADYLKNPDLKRQLWKTLSSLLSSST